VPYFESDHVLNISYNVLTGGTCLEDIDRLRDDPSYADGLSAEADSGPDHRRRFFCGALEWPTSRAARDDQPSAAEVWARQPKAFFRKGIIDVDGTLGRNHRRMQAGHGQSATKGSGGYAPLIVSLANTKKKRSTW